MIEKDQTMTQLATDIGMTKQGLSRMLDNDDFKVSTLLKIADSLKLNPEYFFSVNKNVDVLNDPESHYRVKTESELLFELRDQVRELQKEVKMINKLLLTEIGSKNKP